MERNDQRNITRSQITAGLNQSLHWCRACNELALNPDIESGRACRGLAPGLLPKERTDSCNIPIF